MNRLSELAFDFILLADVALLVGIVARLVRTEMLLRGMGL